VISIAFKTPLQNKIGTCIYCIKVHFCIDLVPIWFHIKLPPTFYNKIAPMC